MQGEARVLLQTGDSLSWQCRNHVKLFVEEAAFRIDHLLPAIRQEHTTVIMKKYSDVLKTDIEILFRKILKKN
jgi:hypothetical protein